MADEKPTMANIRFETEHGKPMTRFRPARILRMRNKVVIDFVSHGSLHNVTDINETQFAKVLPRLCDTVPSWLDWMVLHPLLGMNREKN